MKKVFICGLFLSSFLFLNCSKPFDPKYSGSYYDASSGYTFRIDDTGLAIFFNKKGPLLTGGWNCRVKDVLMNCEYPGDNIEQMADPNSTLEEYHEKSLNFMIDGNTLVSKTGRRFVKNDKATNTSNAANAIDNAVNVARNTPPSIQTTNSSNANSNTQEEMDVPEKSPEEKVQEIADKLGEEFWKKMIIKCGNYSYYQKGSSSYAIVYQVKGETSFQVEGKYHPPKDLTEKDRLNRVDPQPVEYNGVIKLYFDLSHPIKGEICTLDKCQWKDNLSENIAIRKIKGKWYVDPTSSAYQFTPLTCKEAKDIVKASSNAEKD